VLFRSVGARGTGRCDGDDICGRSTSSTICEGNCVSSLTKILTGKVCAGKAKTGDAPMAPGSIELKDDGIFTEIP
jgi:hypothetical protein